MIEKVSTKQREIRSRESRIVSTALRLFDTHGYVKLTIEDIARSMGYSKGTIYNHFPNKEEILLELLNHYLGIRNSLLLTAVRLNIPSREKIVASLACIELFEENFPQYFRIAPILKVEGIIEKTSKKRQVANGYLHANLKMPISEVVRNAISDGDLQMESDGGTEALAAGLCGIITIKPALNNFEAVASSQAEPQAVIRSSLNHFLNGIPWLPLTNLSQMNHLVDSLKSELRNSWRDLGK